ncbi:PaaI family thioesterase [Simiduia sp. 21SJ11W-1]|uniref:PaaI family thioesterase n=1 Tax=Simiduia sp. 21SJ11W-1 TaxID=2909669 RepID=UPI0020A1B61D|nr:PaaI family thioesterase [Simiduia sp. 21SJ11W-1]UTA49115.1 PaaI family thioesterase [Simiduia sp. 21SJ11W-1]
MPQQTHKATDFGLPADYSHWPGDPAEDRLGPFFYLPEDNSVACALMPEAHHCNLHGSVHGGVLMSLGDYALCMALAVPKQNPAVVTVSMQTDFIAPAQAGIALIARGHIRSEKRSLVFVAASIWQGERLVADVTGIVKQVGAS